MTAKWVNAGNVFHFNDASRRNQKWHQSTKKRIHVAYLIKILHCTNIRTYTSSIPFAFVQWNNNWNSTDYYYSLDALQNKDAARTPTSSRQNRKNQYLPHRMVQSQLHRQITFRRAPLFLLRSFALQRKINACAILTCDDKGREREREKKLKLISWRSSMKRKMIENCFNAEEFSDNFFLLHFTANKIAVRRGRAIFRC